MMGGVGGSRLLNPEFLRREEALDELCDPCLQYAKKAHSDGQKDVWKMLPAYFRLPLWKDLKDEV